MKKTIAILFLTVFAGLCFYFFFAEDYCPVHGAAAAGSTFSHMHRALPSVCLCFWGTLFVPGTFDFSCFQGVDRLPGHAFERSPLTAFNADIAHPPKALSS